MVNLLLVSIHIVKLRICRNDETPYYVRYLIWVSLCLFFTLIAASIGEYVSKEAEGSGIPELKSILAGVNIYRYLSFQTFIGKIVGLFSGLAAGLSIGREGPFVHLSAAIANKLAKLKCFSDIESNQTVKKQMLGAAVAAGVTATFGAPIGGVLFSIEVTATYYMVSNLWKGFFCATWGVFMFKALAVFASVELFTTTNYEAVQINHEVIFFALLGLLCGCLGALFIHVLSKIIYLRAKLKLPFISDRWKWCVSVALITGLVTFPVEFLQIPDKRVINSMFNIEDVSLQPGKSFIDQCELDGVFWKEPAVGFNLVIFCILKFILIILAISCPIPAGVFTPTFTLGCVFGRAFGHIVSYTGSLLGLELIQYEGIYAIIGAAALASSVTRTISVAMIVFELNGQTSHMIPVLIGVLISYAISNSLAMSFFDVLLDMKDLPYLPALGSIQHYNQTAADIMNKNFIYLTKVAKIADITVII